MLTEQNKIVNGLWIGNELSILELLTLSSFVKQGHQFNLWVYDEIKTPLPGGVEIQNANEILPESKVFRYKNANKYGHGKGSVAGFSDLFRYKLLYEKGGWWTDMDVTCLNPFEISSPYFFRSHHDLDVVGNVMKCEDKSELMLRCFIETERTVDENNTDWLKPISILNKHIKQLQLENYICKNVSNEDKWPDVRKLIFKNTLLKQEYFFIHWMNEEWRSRGIDKSEMRYNSTLGRLLQQHDLLSYPKSKFDMLKNDTKHFIRYYFNQ